MITSVNAERIADPERGEASRLAELVRRGAEAFFAWDQEWRFTFANEAASELFGRSGDPLVGLRLEDVWPGGRDSEAFQPVVKAMNERAVVELRMPFPGSRQVHVVRCLPVENGLAVLASDEVSRRRVEAELKRMNEGLEQRVAERTAALEREIIERLEVEDRLHTVLDNLPATVFLKDRDGRYLYANPRLRQLIPMAADYEGRTTEELFQWDVAQDFLRTDREVMETGKPVTFEHTFELYNGVRHLLAVKFPITNPAGEIVMICGVGLDITEQKVAENALRKSDRFASLGAMAAGIAHEINNPLSAAWNYIDAARRFAGAGQQERAERCLTDAIESIQTSRDIVENMLRFTRSEPSKRSPMDLRECTRRAIEISRPLANRFGAIVDMEEDELPEIVGNFVQIEQALVNLIGNAIEAGGRDRIVHVSIRFIVEDDAILIVVGDDAGGMSPAAAERAFELFYTEGKEQGVGIGLAIVHAIVDGHGGSVDLKSQPGVGTQITIRLRR